MTLFEHQRQVLIDREAPLAARMRPRSLDEFVGQDAIGVARTSTKWENRLAIARLMPRKIRELKSQIARVGFVYLPRRGKGSLSVGGIRN